VQTLNTGQTLTDTLAVTSLDGSASRTIEVTINGVTDQTIISNGNSGGLVTGTSGNDVIDAGGGNDTVNAGDGNDRITAGTGTDFVNAGAGDDTIIATVGDGTDVYNGGPGSDTVDYSASTAPLSVNLSGFAWSSQTGIDLLTSIENIVGGSGADQIIGNGANNILAGGAGNDRISGGGGNDTLDGGTGNDRLDGGAGNDRLIGGTGDDTLTGGSGSDTFVFAPGFGRDVITDFDANPAGGQDYLDISAFGITSASFSTRVQVADIGPSVLVTIDGSDTITLQGIGNATTVTAQDFWLV
jgi:Ca2+-binding RTX toxin-like protein